MDYGLPLPVLSRKHKTICFCKVSVCSVDDKLRLRPLIYLGASNVAGGHRLGGGPVLSRVKQSLKNEAGFEIFLFILEVKKHTHALRIQVTRSALLFIVLMENSQPEALRRHRTFGEIISLCTTCTTRLSFVFATSW